MAEPQLERSVLESKEREELFAIATALGTGPSSRARKSDLVNQILQATGVEVAEAPKEVPEKPRRTRARKAAADPESAPAAAADPAPAQAALDLGSSEEAGTPAPAKAVAKSTRAPRSAPAETPAPEVAAEPAAEVTPEPAAVAAPPEAPSRPVEPVTSGLSAARSSIGSRPVGAVARAGAAPRPASERRIPPRPDANGSNGSSEARRPVPPAPERAAAPKPEPAAGSNDNRPNESRSHESRGNDNRGNERGNDNRPSDGNDTSGDAGGPAVRQEAETGNRRSRRRRGRDRSERAERDLVGQAPEQPFTGEPSAVAGYLDLRDEGYGFLRSNGYLSGPDDIYVSVSQARRFALRRGDYVEGGARPAGGNEKYPALVRVDKVSGLDAEEARDRARFETLTPLFPSERLGLEQAADPENLTARIVDLLAPIGKGQRGLIVSPPKAGKTTVVKSIARSIEANHPDVHLIVLLVDERPEEVTDMRRSINGEVVASTFDRPGEEHVQIAELVIERAKRLAELGRDVVVVFDGLTRLARAYNLSQPASGRALSGGIDTGALYPPKKFFGAARNIEEGGSLTILATALVETGSRMDEVIFEELKGTGNLELRLDRRSAERRVYPAIDVNATSTRHEELLLDEAQLQQVWQLRRGLDALDDEGNPTAGLELLVERLKSTRTNDEFLADLAKNPIPGA